MAWEYYQRTFQKSQMLPENSWGALVKVEDLTQEHLAEGLIKQENNPLSPLVDRNYEDPSMTVHTCQCVLWPE